MSPWKALFLDLDGVLVDSLPPIRASMNHALVALGATALSDEHIRPLIGPPLEVSAARALDTTDPARIEAFVRHFRTAYDQRFLSETRPARGLHPVLQALSQRFVLLVATSKPEAYAVPLLEHLGVTPYLHAVVGRSLALDSDSKAQVVGRALLHVPDLAPPQILMVGDRHHDVDGARTHGIDTVGVLHGAGDEAELRDAGAVHIVDDLPALRDWLSPAS